mgnify:CR=1 FL=1
MSLSSPPPFEADARAVVGSRFERQRPPMTQARKRVELTFEVPYSHPSWVLEDEKVPISAAQDNATTELASVWREWSHRSGERIRVHEQRSVAAYQEAAVGPLHHSIGVEAAVVVEKEGHGHAVR